MAKKLFNKDFTLLWLGQAVSQLGNGVGFIALMWWVQIETGSAMSLGVLAMVQTLVAFLLSPISGVIADRLSRKHIIIVTDIIRGLVNCLFAYAIWNNILTMPWVLVGAAINAACGQFFGPSITASIPQLVPSELLEKANSLRQMTGNLSNIFGFAVGGILVALFGIPTLMLVNGISFLVSALSEMFITIPAVQEKAKLNLKLFIDDLKSGFKYVKNDGILFKIMQVMVIINFAFVPFFVLLPKFVEEYLGASSHVFGYISSAQVIGMLIGALILTLTRLVHRNIWIIKWGIAIQAIVLCVSPLFPAQIWQIQLLTFGVYGVLNSIVNIFFFSAIQRKVDPAFLGKIFSLLTAMGLGLQPVASVLSGIFANWFGIASVFIGAGILGALSNLLLARIPKLEEYFLVENEEVEQIDGAEVAATS